MDKVRALDPREPWREVGVVLSVNEALAGHPRLVVLGAPGSGKTTFLHYLALTYARDLRGDRRGLLGQSPADRT